MLLCESVKRFLKIILSPLVLRRGSTERCNSTSLNVFSEHQYRNRHMWICLSFFSEYSKSSRLMYIHLMGIFLESSSAAVVCVYAGFMARRKSISPACLSPTVILCTLCQTLQQVYILFLLPDSEKRVLGRPRWTPSSAICNIWHVFSGYHLSVSRCQLPSGATHTSTHTHACTLSLRPVYKLEQLRFYGRTLRSGHGRPPQAALATYWMGHYEVETRGGRVLLVWPSISTHHRVKQLYYKLASSVTLTDVPQKTWLLLSLCLFFAHLLNLTTSYAKKRSSLAMETHKQEVPCLIAFVQRMSVGSLAHCQRTNTDRSATQYLLLRDRRVVDWAN